MPIFEKFHTIDTHKDNILIYLIFFPRNPESPKTFMIPSHSSHTRILTKTACFHAAAHKPRTFVNYRTY